MKKLFQCSVTCGVGIVRRLVRCNVPDESACEPIEKPIEEEKCFVPPCSGVNDYQHENEISTKYGVHDKNYIQSNKLYSWRTDPWSSVSYYVLYSIHSIIHCTF